MADFNTDMNVQFTKIIPKVLVDEVSSTTIYIGVSNNSRNVNSSDWQIKKMVKLGNVWAVDFPDGDQGFNYKWSIRLAYSYS